MDHPRQEPLTALAKANVSRYLDPVISDPMPYMQSHTDAMMSVDIFGSIADTKNTTLDSALSRVVDKIVVAMTGSTSKYLTVSISTRVFRPRTDGDDHGPIICLNAIQ